MLFFIKARVELKELSMDELWDKWDEELTAADAAQDAGKLVSAYKVSGMRCILAILDVESHDELDKILSTLPMAKYVEFEEILPIRPREDFAIDVRNRWQ